MQWGGVCPYPIGSGGLPHCLVGSYKGASSAGATAHSALRPVGCVFPYPILPAGAIRGVRVEEHRMASLFTEGWSLSGSPTHTLWGSHVPNPSVRGED